MGQIDLDGSNSTLKADVIRGQASTTVKLGGLLDTDGNYIQTEKGGDLTSASPLVVDTDGDYFDVTGTTNFTAMTVAADRQFTLQFDGVLTMTHHATNLDLPSEANITTAAGDVGVFQSTGADTVQCIAYTRADGTAVVAAAGVNVFTDTISVDLSSVTGAQAYTGFGFTPKLLIFMGAVSGVETASWGMTTGGVGTDGGFGYNAGSSVFNLDGSPLYAIIAGGNRNVAVWTSFDADGFTLTWSETGTMTGSMNLIVTAIG
ncbi:MAG: hypothetical protein QGH83_06160 [Candidatus Pacebacteria bacterium]|nr:hypothetical protein [Candidatus Paceibacterota bacterium]